MSPDGESAKGAWASGPTPDGKGEFTYLERPGPYGPEAEAPPPDPRTYGTGRPGLVQQAVNKLKK